MRSDSSVRAARVVILWPLQENVQTALLSVRRFREESF